MTSSYPPDLSIRFATVEDVPTILGFIRALAEYERLLHEVVADKATLEATLFGESRAAEVLLAEVSGTAVGFALFFRSYSTFLGKPGLYLEDLFVHPDQRGRGVGLALMSALARIATQRGYGRFEWSVLAWNEPSLQFYASLGAVQMRDWMVHRMTGPALGALADRWPHTLGKT